MNYVFLPVYFGEICIEERRSVEVTMIIIDYTEVSLHTASQTKYSQLFSLAHLLTLDQQFLDQTLPNLVYQLISYKFLKSNNYTV